MSKFVGIIIGAAEIVGGIVTEIFLPGNPLGVYLIAAGIGTTIHGIGTAMSSGPMKGFGTASRNPISPRNVVYGRTKIAGTIIYINEFGEANKYLDLIFVLASHPCRSVDSLLFDNQPIQLSTNHSTFTGVGDSFTPLQQDVPIFHISRANDIVTVVLHANIPLLVVGNYVIITGVTGDRTLNGKFQVAQIISQVIGAPGSITLSYVSGGPPAIVDNQGSVQTTWQDYRAKVHMEVLLGDHTTTFPGMLGGTAYDGDTGNLIRPDSNPWTADHKLLGCCAVFLRLHYNDEVFVNGLPNISFLVSGKKDIYDPRTSPVTYGYSENSALCIADYLSNQRFGFKAIYGTEIPLPELIAAANICDEAVPVAIGGTEPRYACNGQFPLTIKRGDVLQNMLTSCGGRLTYNGGQFVIHPAAWPGVGLDLGGGGKTIASATISVITAHTSGGAGYGNATLGDNVLSGPTIVSDSSDWATRTNSLLLSAPTDASLRALEVWFRDWDTANKDTGATFGGLTPPCELRIFDCSILVTYADGSTGTWRATAVRANNPAVGDGNSIFGGAGGSVTDEANAIDGSTATYALIQRTVFRSLADYNVDAIVLSAFQPIAGSVVPDTSPGGVAATAALLAIASGPFRWRQKVGIRDLYNGVKGTFVSPANNWQSSDIPPYAQDALHGYGSGPGTPGSGGGSSGGGTGGTGGGSTGGGTETGGGSSSGTGGSTGSGGSNSAGAIRIHQRAGSNWDAYTNSTDPTVRSFIQAQVTGITSFTPFFDAKLAWFPEAWVYIDSYAVYHPSEDSILADHPTWILHDGGANPLYIPFDCAAGTCPQWAGNIADAGFRAYMISKIRSYIAPGYVGIWFDDVNLDITRVGNGSGTSVTPIDPATGVGMTNDAWKAYFATFVEEVRAAFPALSIIHNPIWYVPGDSSVDREIGASDIINLERGYGDGGLTNGETDFSVFAFMNFIDHVHSLGKRVIVENLFKADLHYGTAGYLLTNNGADYLSFLDQAPDGTWPTALFAMNLGAATSTRYRWNGLWRRDFTHGLVLLNEPGNPTVTVTMPQDMVDENGTTYSSVTLAAKEGIVLRAAAIVSVPVVVTSFSYTTTWLGNTFPGGTVNGGSNVGKWVQDRIWDMTVQADGTLITNSNWDENGSEAAVIDLNGLPVLNTSLLGFGTPGFNGLHANAGAWHIGGSAADGDIVWLTAGHGLIGRFSKTSRNFAAVAGFVSVSGGPIGGLAVNTGAGELYACAPNENLIFVRDASNLTAIRSFAFTAPGKIAVDGSGNLWITRTTDGKVYKYSSTGTNSGTSITLPGSGIASALAVSNTGKLMVGDNGPRQQIVLYDISGAPSVSSTFGATGGLYSGTPGAMAPLKLYAPVGVGTDASGNIYVACGLGRTLIRKFTSGGTLLWEISGNNFVDATDFDHSTDGVDVYSIFGHYAMDYSQSNGQEWSLVGVSVNPLAYPNDPRIFGPELSGFGYLHSFRTIGGTKVLALTDQYGSYLMLFRLNGEIAVPSFIFAPLDKFTGLGYMAGAIPAGQSWNWRDANGNGEIESGEIFDASSEFFVHGWDIDSAGHVWQVFGNGTIRRVNYQGSDTHGNPIYDYSHTSTFGGTDFTNIQRIRYDSDADRMYISGFTAGNPNAADPTGKNAGTVFARYDNWLAGNRVPTKLILLPYSDPVNDLAVSAWDIAGTKLFAAVQASSGASQSGSPHNVYVFDLNTGELVGECLPGPEIGSGIGFIDAIYGVHAFQRANGEYVVSVEEVFWNKQAVYRILAP